MSVHKVDVLVIGGGIVGACVARELQTSGRQVTLVERGQPGQACSYANAGWLTPCFAMPLPQPGMFWKSIGWLFDPTSPLHIQPNLSPTLARWMWLFLRAMNREQMEKSVSILTKISTYSLDFYRELSSRSPRPIGFESRGLLMVSGTAAGLDYATIEMQLMKERGIDGRFLNQDEVLGFEPAVRPIVRGGVYFPGEAQADPYATTLAVMDEFTAAGGTSHAGAEAYQFEIENGRIRRVFTTRGVFEAELVVLATGAWSKSVAKELKLNIPILGGKGYSMSVDMPGGDSGGIESDSRKPKVPIMIVEKKIAVTPFRNHVRLAGTLELVDQDFSISSRRLQGVHSGAREYLKFDSDFSEARDIWRGLRPCTPDGVPIIGPSTRIENLFYCAGHQLLGFQSAPGSARLAADLILGRSPLVDPKGFQANRFE